MKSLLADLALLRVSTQGPQIVAKRYLPARGTKPLPRYLWDLEDLKKKSGGQLGGRHPETGRKINQHIGGGVKFDYFMIDYHSRAGDIMGSDRRWLYSGESLLLFIGEGNSYPIGSLVAGTLVNSVERFPTLIENLDSDVFIIKAGTAATIVRHQGDFTVIRLPHKHEFSLHRTCMARVGRLSHADIEGKIYGSAQMHRRFGYKMASGLFHKKDGYFGRKIRPLPPVRVLDEPTPPPPPNQQFSLTKDQLSGLFGHAKVHNLLPAGYSTRDYDYYKPDKPDKPE
ncbi:ribosomal protein L2 domain protein [Ostertagia ostertagi]